MKYQKTQETFESGLMPAQANQSITTMEHMDIADPVHQKTTASTNMSSLYMH